MKAHDNCLLEKTLHAMRVNHLLIILASIRVMLVSHRHKFILFQDPLGTCPWMERVLQPWLDQPVASKPDKSSALTLSNGMSPTEAERAFDKMGLPFREYTRIAMIRNPYAKMAQLYYRICVTDPVWRLRHHVGLELPEFGRWLRSTKTKGVGAGYPTSASWRKYGAWSAETWCSNRITHTVRVNHAVEDLKPIFAGIGLAPAFGNRECHELGDLRLTRLYNAESSALIRDRYASDLRLYQEDPVQLRPATKRPAQQWQPSYQSVA